MAIRMHPHDNTWIVSRSMQCGKQPRMDAQSFALNQRRVLAAEEGFRLRISPGHPFCHTLPLEETVLQVYLRKPL